MAPSPDTTHSRAAHCSPIRLLIVEDDLSTVFAVREFFALVGYDVDCAAGLRDTDVLLERNAYDAVITDLHLSALRSNEGLLVARHARRRNPHACIVMLSGFGSETTVCDARRCGVDLYQNKPVQLAQLSMFLERMLRPDAATARVSEVEPQWHLH